MNAETPSLGVVPAWNSTIDGTLPKIDMRALVTCYRVPAKNDTAATARAGASAAAIFRRGRFVPDDGAAVRSELDTRPQIPRSEDDEGLPLFEVSLTIEHRELDASAVVTAYGLRAPDERTAIALAAASLGREVGKLSEIRFIAVAVKGRGGPAQPKLFARPENVDADGVVTEPEAPAAAATEPPVLASGGVSRSRVTRASITRRAKEHVAAVRARKRESST